MLTCSVSVCHRIGGSDGVASFGWEYEIVMRSVASAALTTTFSSNSSMSMTMGGSELGKLFDGALGDRSGPGDFDLVGDVPFWVQLVVDFENDGGAGVLNSEC